MKFTKAVEWEKLPALSKTVLAVDPSEGKGDSTAYVVAGEANGGIFVVQGEKALHDPYRIMDRVCELIEEYPQIEQVDFESNLFKDLLKMELIKKMCERGCYRQINYNHASENKYIRIMKMEPDITGGKILLNPLNVDFNTQVKSYSRTCKHDDCADGLQIAWKALKLPSYYMG